MREDDRKIETIEAKGREKEQGIERERDEGDGKVMG